MATIGGNDQVTYIRNLPKDPFTQNPKPFFGYSDNSHFINHLWQCGVPAYYGCCLFTQFSDPKGIDEFTLEYLNRALFAVGEVEVAYSKSLADSSANKNGLDWGDGKKYLESELIWEDNIEPFWDVKVINSAQGILWGGCLESLDEMLRHRIELPAIDDWSEMILYIESSEEIPPHEYTRRVIRALGELGHFKDIKGVLIGRPMGSNFDVQPSIKVKQEYRRKQFNTIADEIRKYNIQCPIAGNLDFGHTKPQFCVPSGRQCKISTVKKSIEFQY